MLSATGWEICTELPRRGCTSAIVEVPLLPDDGSVPVDLQQVFATTYDAGPYRRMIDYSRDKITPPLRKEQQKWMIGQLRDKEIARVIGRTEHTAKIHVRSILTKLGATDRTEAVSIAIARGYLHSE